MNVKKIPAAVAIIIGLLIWFVIPIPHDVTPQAWHLLAIFVAVIAGIIGKAMPIGALSIIGIMLVAVTGVTSNSPKQAISDALSGFSNSLIWLIGIAVMISRGLLKTGLGNRFAYLFIAIWGKRTLGIAYSLAISEIILAPVTPSNTARGGGIIHPLMRAMADSFGSSPEKHTEGLIGKYLALVNAHGNVISSAMFITATAPNPLMVSLVAEATGMNLHITWTQWAIAMCVPAVAAMIVMPIALYLLYPPEIKKTPDAIGFAKQKLQEMGPMKRDEIIMLFIFAVLLILWAGIPAMIFGSAFAVNSTTTAFIGLSLCLITGVLTWQDVLAEKSAWDTITWFSALVMMATFLNKLGLITWFSGVLQTSIGNLGWGWLASCMLLLLAYMYAHYMFASTTAHTTAMFGAFYAAGLALGAPPMIFALMMISASSIMMGLTHYATGTSPVIFNSGYVTMGEWWKAGFIMSVVDLIIFLSVGAVWWGLVLGY